MKALFIDFDDSFSYNIIQELTEVGYEVNVINWKDYEENPSQGLLVLGPGPGHPDDYLQIYPLIKSWLALKKPFFAVCLGHQIFWRIKEGAVLRSKTPLHGQKVKLCLTQEWSKWLNVPPEISVQRYNSLCVPALAANINPEVKTFIHHDEILMTRASNIITYQFHPESIGTSFRKSFFKVVPGIMK
jgi:anthranilate/para-aminobenzoate synthase component II